MPLMEYDISDNVILITFSNDEIFGLKKIDVLDFMNTEIVFQINYKELLLTNRLPSLSHKRSFTIKDLKISPFSDGTVMICYDKNVIFLNIRNNTVLLDLKMENSITSVEFDKNDRNISYAGDSKGNLIKIDMSGFIESEKISTLPIHSIHMIKNQKIFLGTFKGVFLKDSENCEFFEVSTVTNIFGDDENVIFAIRQPDKTMMHIQIDKNGLDDPNKMFFSFKETRRLRERMHNNLLFVINNEKHSLVLYDTFGTENAVLEVGDEIICCCLGPDAIYVLTVKGFVIFS
ncbi:RING-finger-containing E3 ubiquitin ligase [Pseudoloma neurophilia]|uniref:RING-finger-containing E3 ubiquitin ligase n=1 Tax=Pseudoloma neurophilia TaxID=146866 RepID=A0A0R0LSR7_9MICR|nr:RING-finger-containing E3 ubiquitin ligase [Pseudoloma neurophilia]